jgi:hypothetical protein
MHRILSASKDTYITNKLINNAFRAKDANVGQAGTLDLFKLHNETALSGSSDAQTEISRILIKFPISEVTRMQNNGDIDITDSSFKCQIKLHDVYGGQSTPNNFSVILFPLAQGFDEGTGRDLVEFSDVDSSNFITASYSNGTLAKWNTEGAMKSGSLGTSNLDVYTSGSLGAGLVSLSPIQHFSTGKEDLIIDVTNIVSGTVTGQIADNGFLIALSGSFEQDTKSYFVKRFASRNVKNASKRPKLIVRYNDSLQDYHQDFIFNVSSSLYLHNYHYGSLSNVLSGTAATALTGENCMILKIVSGTFSQSMNVSQAKRGTSSLTGIYSASFAISSFDPLLYNKGNLTGSITFDEVWSSSDQKVAYLSSSLTIEKEGRSALNSRHQNLLVSVLNLNKEYRENDVIKLRVFTEDRNRPIVFVKTPLEKKSQAYHNMHYRVRDFQTGDILIDFDKTYSSTKLSTDTEGMYFTFYIDSLPKGRTYVFDFLIIQDGFDTVVTDAASKFRVV